MARSGERHGLAGKTAVVTGTAHGIGAAIAEALRADGARVHGVDKDTADLTDPPRSARSSPASAPSTSWSTTPAASAARSASPLEEVSDEDWHAVVDANLTSAFLCTRAVGAGHEGAPLGPDRQHLLRAPGLTVSMTGIQAYASAKAGQIGFTRQMAHELGPFGITVNCIAPGFILSNPTTERQWESYGDGRAARAGRRASRCGGSASPRTSPTACSSSSPSGPAWVTGQIIAIDGGSALL